MWSLTMDCVSLLEDWEQKAVGDKTENPITVNVKDNIIQLLLIEKSQTIWTYG